MTTKLSIQSRPCMMCQQVTTIPVTQEQDRQLADGAPIQEVFPDMAPAEREVFISGTHPKCWETLFGPGPTRNWVNS